MAAIVEHHLDIARQHDRREDAEALMLRVFTQLAADVVQTIRRNVSESARPGRVALLAWNGDVTNGFVTLTDPTDGIPTPIPPPPPQEVPRKETP